MIQFGMRGHDICPKGPLTQVLDTFEALGVTHIQLAPGKSFSDFDFAFGRYSSGMGWYLAKELAARKLHVAVLGCYINPANPDETARETAILRFIDHLRCAKRIGADMVGTETGRFSADFSVTPATQSEECYQTVLKSFRRIVRAAEQIGVTVGVEGVFDHTLSDPKRMKRFLDDIDSENVEVILDGVNLIPPGAELDTAEQTRILDEAFELYGPRISVLHLKDFVFEGSRQLYRHPGEGHFYYPALMAHIKKEKPQIIGLLENSSPEHFKRDCAYLQTQYNLV